MTEFVQRGLKRLPLAVAVLAAFAIAPAALAQSQPASSPSTSQSTTSSSATNQAVNDNQATEQNKQDQEKTNNEQEATRLQGVTVTGSLIQMPENESVVPVQTVNIQANISTGDFGTAGVLMGTAIAAGTTEINGQFGGFIVNGGTGVQSVDLRGLGAGRTLVLMNGQRPGPAGVRGAVAAFDLNVVPVSIIQRIDIVKAGSSSIYGSDAIAGVVNIITKQYIPNPIINVRAAVPTHGGGEQYLLSFADGWDIDAGNFVLALQVDRQNELKVGQRPFLNCQQSRYWDASGQRYEIPDRSIMQGTRFEGCGGMLHNIILGGPTGRLVPTKDGHTGPLSPVPGFKAHQPIGYGPGEVPYDDEVTYAAFLNDTYAIQQRDRASLYGAANLHFGDIGWSSMILYSYRKTQQHGYRQFFPYAIQPWHAGAPPTLQPDAAIAIVPVLPYPADTDVKVDYFYGATKVTGFVPWTRSWTWEVNGTYSKSRGTYTVLGPGIDARKSGDFFGQGTTAFGAPGSVVRSPYAPIDLLGNNYGYLTGANMQQLVDTFGLPHQGYTTFTQETANVLFTGDLFDWWAGTARAAFGAEVRHKALKDTPSEATLNGWLWGATSAGVTQGTDNVKEVFTQLGIPLVSGVPGFEKLSLDVSARGFRYQSVGSSSYVWRVGVNWQIIPTVRIRGSLGTSYKAPTLHQLYLADQTGFLSQISIDPCVNWGESNNQDVRTNCAAAGIPPDYDATGSASALIHSGGGKGFLTPEVARAKSFGVVWTPSFANMSITLNYFDYQIRDEVGQLSAGTIVGGCYGREVFPNRFCDQLERNPPDAAHSPNMITNVFATYTNINREHTRGYDLFGNWQRQFSFGTLNASADIVYTINDSTQLFSTTEASGFNTSERIGFIGNPYTVAVFHASWKRGHWRANWQGRYFSSTRAKFQPKTFNLFGNGPLVSQDTVAASQFRQSASVTYSQPAWDLTFGVRNIFDKKPDLVSPSAVQTTPYGNAALAATQYDYFGRTLFMHLQYSFL